MSLSSMPQLRSASFSRSTSSGVSFVSSDFWSMALDSSSATFPSKSAANERNRWGAPPNASVECTKALWLNWMKGCSSTPNALQ